RVIGRHDERDVTIPGIRDRAEHVRDEGVAVDRPHGLPPDVSRALLCGRQRRGAVAFLHAGAEPTREDDGACHMWTISSGGVVFQRPRVKSGKSTVAALRPADCTLRWTTALSPAAS